VSVETMIGAIRSANKTRPASVTYGTIASVDPLSIRIDGDQEPLPAQFFHLGQMLQPMRVRMPHTHTYTGMTGESGMHSHAYTGATDNPDVPVTVEIFPPLAAGDVVMMFPFNDSQLFYVAERVENDT